MRTFATPAVLLVVVALGTGCSQPAEKPPEPAEQVDRSGAPQAVQPPDREQAAEKPPELGKTGKAEGPPKELTIDLGGGVKMEFVLIPAGEFMMGSRRSPDEVAKQSGIANAKADRFAGEHPLHKVRIAKPFYLGKYEVTQQQYRAVTGGNPSWFCTSGGGKDRVKGMDTDRLPAEMVSWHDAVEFCRALSSRAAETAAGRFYRLPTEAEWEYACRAGTSGPFHFGDSLNGNEANCNGIFPCGTATKGPYLERTTAVGSYRPNTFGLHDMHGNVWEWCADRHGSDYYVTSPQADPQGPEAGFSRVLRGGCWLDFASRCRSAQRFGFAPDFRFDHFGFRVAMPVAPGAAERKKHMTITNSIGMKLVLIPAGEFMMGSPESEPGRGLDEGPPHRVKFSKPFYLGQHEVTVGQFREFVKAERYTTGAERFVVNAATDKHESMPEQTWKKPGFTQTDEHPVVCVSWHDAQVFCLWLTRKEGKQYLLPTEAEWEYACRAGTRTRFQHGDDEEGLLKIGNVADTSARREDPAVTWGIKADDGYAFTATVGRFRMNDFGLFDMHGNVWEWCGDRYGRDYYGKSPVKDPQGPEAGEVHVTRGGSWLGGASICRSANRGRGEFTDNFKYVGFRVVRVR